MMNQPLRRRTIIPRTTCDHHAKHERLLRRIRIRLSDYQDTDRTEKAERIIKKIKAICQPEWRRRSKRNEDRILHRVWDR